MPLRGQVGRRLEAESLGGNLARSGEDLLHLGIRDPLDLGQLPLARHDDGVRCHDSSVLKLLDVALEDPVGRQLVNVDE